MKRLALLVSLALLTVVGTTATTQAYYLDTPHNESNGIYCYTCHSMPEFTSYTPTGGIDDTMRNAVCLKCHKVGATDPKKGPSKNVHSSATTGDTNRTWTTECTQCHDVHSQGQLDWATADSASLYLASGTLGNGGTWVAKDLIDSPTYGSTTFAISNITGQAGWTDTSKWINKGGHADKTRAVDQSRGLVFVPNKANPNESYEIIVASPTSIKVKGRVSTTGLSGKSFGIIYGQSLKSYILPNGGTTTADYRDVKFFQPSIIAGTFGGFVDESATDKPLGLCQVCHTTTSYWQKTGAVPTHNAETVCSNCHDIVAGGAATASDHTVFIADRLNSGCISCHSTKIANPDTAHASCSVCHTASAPA